MTDCQTTAAPLTQREIVLQVTSRRTAFIVKELQEMTRVCNWISGAALLAVILQLSMQARHQTEQNRAGRREGQKWHIPTERKPNFTVRV